MSGARMHDDEVATDVALVRRLLRAQLPRWAELPVGSVTSAGTDNAMYRLGGDMTVRLPRTAGAARNVAEEQRWLPLLAPLLPLEVPEPLALGEPSEDFPFPWSVLRWLDGVDALAEPLHDSRASAAALGRFVAALQRVDLPGGPPSWRGVPLSAREGDVRAALALLDAAGTHADAEVDTAAGTAAWEAALGAAEWAGPPVWTHGDLLPGNLLVRDGRLRAVVDFGGIGVGDPACDLLAAWATFSAAAREAFRAELRVDDAMWARGRGWALCFGLVALPYYRASNPVLAGVARRAVVEVLADR